MSTRVTLPPVYPPTLAEVEQVARQALLTLPADMLASVREIIIKVEDFPSEEVMEETESESPYDLLGLYQGVDLPGRSVEDVGRLPDMIYLYRRPILDYWCETGEPLPHLIRHVMIHEIGHHFGFSDEEMEELEEA